jgi:hypothetical protein
MREPLIIAICRLSVYLTVYPNWDTLVTFLLYIASSFKTKANNMKAQRNEIEAMQVICNIQAMQEVVYGRSFSPFGGGFSCLGFDVCLTRLTSLAAELGESLPELQRGSMEVYNEHQRMLDIARKKHTDTGWRSQSELIPEFIGNEGRRVEVITKWGEKSRFIIGKSTGFIPCHLEIKRKDSTGGCAVMGHPFQSIKFLS